MLFVMDESIHEEHLFQPLQMNNKQFRIAVTFLTCYNGIFIVTDKKIRFCFTKLLTEDYIIINIPEGASESESLNDEIKRIIIHENHYTEENYPFRIKPNFSTLGGNIELSTHGSKITFVPDDSISDLLGLIRLLYLLNIIDQKILLIFYHLIKIFLKKI